MKHRALTLLVLLSLSVCMTIPAAALLFDQSDDEVSVAAFAKNGTADDTFTFSVDDFAVSGDAELSAIVVESLPDAGAGLLKLGSDTLAVGDSISVNALSGLCFCPLSSPTVTDTSFSFTPVFDDGLAGASVTVSLHVLSEENAAPIAENLTLSTYRDVAITGQFAAVDPEGDLITFRLVSKPARGQVELSDDGSGTFVYTPYEGKTGKDTFTYVAVDQVGNTSKEATVKVTISKPDTKVTYADMDGNPSYRSALRLAEEGVLVGTQVDGVYYFQPDQTVSRDEFVAMAMSAAGLEALDGISVTGFADDSAIPAWSKGYVSSALRAGIVEGSADEEGDICFHSGDTITKAEAAVIVNRLLDLTDVSSVDAMAETVPAWASQAAANLTAVSVLSDLSDMDQGLTRAQAADLLCGMLEVLDNRDSGWF